MIRNAIERKSNSCMIANAIRLQVPGSEIIHVDLQTIRFSLPEHGQRFVYLTPRQSQESIVAFDAGDYVEPFEFTLRNPGITATRASTGKERVTRGDGVDAVKIKKSISKTPPRLATTSKRQFGLRGLRDNQPAVSIAR